MKKLRLYNGGDWDHRGGHLYIAAYSVKDAVAITNEAHGKVRKNPHGMTEYWFNTYFYKGAWGRRMDGIVPERGVWWVRQDYGPGCKEKPERLL